MTRTSLILAIFLYLFASTLALKQCHDNGINSGWVDTFDSINEAFRVTSYGLPQCLEGEELHQAENRNNSDPSFVILNETLVVLEDHSMHPIFCIQSNGDYTIASFCQATFKSRCENIDCVRQCCQIQQVFANHISNL